MTTITLKRLATNIGPPYKHTNNWYIIYKRNVAFRFQPLIFFHQSPIHHLLKPQICLQSPSQSRQMRLPSCRRRWRLGRGHHTRGQAVAAYREDVGPFLIKNSLRISWKTCSFSLAMAYWEREHPSMSCYMVEGLRFKQCWKLCIVHRKFTDFAVMRGHTRLLHRYKKLPQIIRKTMNRFKPTIFHTGGVPICRNVIQ